MPKKRITRRGKKAGLPPGTPVHIGERKVERIRVRMLDYDADGVREEEVETLDACIPFRDAPTVTWVDVDGIHDVETLAKLADCFKLHPLVLEDLLNSEQRAKMEDYGDYIYVVLKMLHLDKHDEVVAEQVSLVLGPHFVLSLQEREGDVFDPIRERIRAGKGRMRKLGADYLAYALLDAVVDNYFVVLEQLGEKIEMLEDELIASPSPEMLRTVHHYRREMILLRRAVWPLREAIGLLERGETSLIQESTSVYLRDLYDHTIQVIETVETFRDILSGMLDIYLSSVSNRMNEVMKVLTIIATIFMPLTFLAGVYGMNFKHMPELQPVWTYPALWLAMIGIAGAMLWYFRKKKWL